MENKEDIKSIINILKFASLKEKEESSVKLDGLCCKTLYGYIKQLETEKQKLIKDLEGAIDFTKTGRDLISKVKVECLENVLKIVKGENDE